LADSRDNRAAWLEALEVLEAYVFEADVVDAKNDDWVAPAALGPLPADLIDRATRLLAAQRERMAAIDTSRRSVGRHLSAVRSIATPADTDRSVYLDVTS
jgi:hypothetical protein